MSASHLSLCPHTVTAHPTTPKPLFVHIGGDLAVGTLLSQIVFWFTPKKSGGSKTPVKRHGYEWVAKTREAWMVETGLGAAQYKRAIRVLKRMGLIEVRRMRFGGLAISHLRLIRANFTAAQEAALSQQQKSTHRSGGPRPIGRAIPAPSYTEITNRDYEQSSCEDARARAGTILDRSGEQGERRREEIEDQREEEIELREVHANETSDALEDVEEILGPMETLSQTQVTPPELSPPPVLPSKEPTMPTAVVEPTAHPAKPSSLTAFWLASNARLSGGGYQRPLTGKEAGQLKQLQKYLGTQTQAVITYALEHWWKFGSHAGGGAGGSWPGSPHIGFLLTHHAVAVNLLQPVAKIPVLKSKPTQGVTPAMEPVQEEEDPHLKAELAEMLADLQQ